MTSRGWRVAVAVLLAVTLGACGGDDDDDEAASSSTGIEIGPVDPDCPPPNLALIDRASFSMTSNVPELVVGGTATWKISITNVTDATVPLTFLSSQIVDIFLRDEADAIVYKWSTDRSFAQQVRCEEFEAGQTRDYEIVEERPFAVPPGDYTMEVLLAAAPTPPSVVAEVAVAG